MSTVKTETEPTTTTTTAAAETAAATAAGVQVKFEPSLSTADIKSEGDDQNEAPVAPKNQRQWICNYTGCGRSFIYASDMKMHQHEHRLQTELTVHGKSYTLTRQSLNDRWPCPFPDCTSTLKTVDSVCAHIRKTHGKTIGQQQKRTPIQTIQYKRYFHDVDDFYVNGVRCGYHNTIGLFICHECKLVPECLLTHLQQKHGYDEKSIDSSALPESADPSVNQHTSNPLLVSAIHEPSQPHNPDIVHGWVCVASDCGCCGYTIPSKSAHKKIVHYGEQITTIPALVLRLFYGKAKTSCFLITRLDTVTTNSAKPSTSTSQRNSECDDD